MYLENKGGKFKVHQLPVEAQISSVNEILVNDYDKDGYLDILLAGNLLVSEVETPRNDAGYGLFLKGNGKELMDIIALNCKLPTYKIASILLQMELKGVIRPLPGKIFEII